MIGKLDVSPYLLAAPRSLRQACMDVAECGGSRDRCGTCALLDLCAPSGREPEPLPHAVQRAGARDIAGSAMRSTALAALARLRRF